MTTSRWRANYREREVRALIEEYAAFRAKENTTRGGLRVLVQIADLDRAMRQLPRKYWEVVLLHGLIGLSQEDTARALSVSQQAVSKRYRHGLEEILYLINGGID